MMNLLELKYDRLSEPERFLLDIFDGLEKYIDGKYPDSIFYEKDNNVIFEYHPIKQSLWYSYDHIRVYFIIKFNINYQEANNLIQSVVEDQLNLKVKTTDIFY